MDKTAYFNQSKELNLPPRCPLIGYCERWAYSIYHNTYRDSKLKNKETVFEFLQRRHELPSDFDQRIVKSCGEALESSSGKEYSYGKNFCPEISLFTEHRLGIIPKEAISSYSWDREYGLSSIEYRHFSECVEFIQANYFQEIEAQKLSNQSLAINSFGYVSKSRIQELKEINSNRVDLVKLIRLCEELNVAQVNNLNLTMAMLLRAVLDHVPPIFSKASFKEVIAGYGTRSFKETMRHLEEGARKIADSHLHGQIRRKETLPTYMQVNFSQNLDVLLGEVVVLLKSEATPLSERPKIDP